MSEHRPALEHIQAYADHLRLEEKSAATVEKYLRDVRAFARWLEGREITKERTAAWKTHLVERGYAPASVNAMLSALNSLLDFLGFGDCRVKFLKVQRRLFRDDSRDLTRADYERPHRCGQGAGQDAAGPADGGHLRHRHPGQRGAVYHRGGGQSGPGGGRPEGQDPHHPHPQQAVPQAAEIRQNSKKPPPARSFSPEAGRPLSRRQIWAEMKGLCEDGRGGSPARSFPTTCATCSPRTFYRASRDIVKLADVLGHSSLETTRIYLLTSGAEHQRQLDRLGLVS